MSDLAQVISDCTGHLKKQRQDQIIPTLSRLKSQELSLAESQKVKKFLIENETSLLSSGIFSLKRIAILGDYTVQPIEAGLIATLVADGIWADCYCAEYDTIRMEVLNPDSGLYKHDPDIVLFASGISGIKEFPEPFAEEKKIIELVDKIFSEYSRMWEAVHDSTNALIIQHDFAPPDENPLGRLESFYPWSKSRFLEQLNQKFWQNDHPFVEIASINQLAKKIGTKNWFSPRWYHFSKHGFDPKYVSSYAKLLKSTIHSCLGRFKKCLVLDLDNTLWGGVVGDEGTHGIELGNISASGEAYLAFCRYVKSLKDRGVLIAINSKNDPENARVVFEKHPEMPLKLNDFSSFICNWNAKSTNLLTISEELNIGLDSIVMVDDSSFECAQIRSALPEVEVLELSDADPSDFIRILEEMNFFDQPSLTKEDFSRTESLSVNRKINSIKSNPEGMNEFLESLEMKATFHESKSEEIERLEQLLLKTNQFNLTAQRFNKAEIEDFIQTEGKFCYSCTLEDRHAYHGIVSCVLGQTQGEILEIENWVMSCRVFSRTLEGFIISKLLRTSSTNKAHGIKAKFQQTSKNSILNDILPKIGFIKDEEPPVFWQLDSTDSIKSFVRG
jgi:FkbH-like protein